MLVSSTGQELLEIQTHGNKRSLSVLEVVYFSTSDKSGTDWVGVRIWSSSISSSLRIERNLEGCKGGA